MSLSVVALPAADVPGTVEPIQRTGASTHAIGLQHPLPPAHHMNHLPPHQLQHWAQPLNALHPPSPAPVTLATLSSLLASTSPARPSPFLLSLRVGDEVDALDEIGYRQWRHAFILELGHIPGQTVHDSARIGEYKIRWAGWDSKWDEFVHGNRIAPLNSKVIGDTGPEAISEKESAHRIGREWRQARQAGCMTDVAITFQPDSNTAPPVHRRSLSTDDSPSAPLMLAHLALLSVRCPSLLAFFTDAPSDEGEQGLSYQLHPQADSHVGAAASTTSAAPLDSSAEPTALPPPISARLHSDMEGGGWRRGRLSTPAGVRGGVIEVMAVESQSPHSARPASLGHRPATADASTIRDGTRAALLPTHHHSSSSSTSAPPRRALNFSQVAPAGAASNRRAPPTSAAMPPATARVPVPRSKSHLTPTVPSLSASAPTSPLTGTVSGAMPPTLIAGRVKVDSWTASALDEEVEREVGSTLEAMTAAVEVVDSIQGQDPLDFADSDDEGGAAGKEEKKEEIGFVPLSDDDEASHPASSSTPTPAPAQLIPVFCVPGIRTYAALRAFVEFVYTDSFDASVQAAGARPKPKAEAEAAAPADAGLRRPRRHVRDVGVGGAEGEDSDEERLGLMGDPDLEGLEDELLHQAIAARYGRQLNAAATRALAQELGAGLRHDAEVRAEAAGEVEEVEPANPAHVLAMADLFDLACIGSRFHFPRLIALCASQLSDTLSVENIMEALQLCVRVGCLGGEEEDILASIFSSSSSSLLPPSSIAPPSSSSLPSHRVHDLSILLRIAFDFLSHHWDVVMKRDTSVKILHTLPFPAFSAVVQVKGRSVNSTHGSGRYTPPVVHHPASRLVRDIKQLYLQRGPPPTSTPPLSTGAPLLVAGARTSAEFPSASTFRFPACDFQIVVGDVVHWAHRSVLACRSEYFRALFSSRMQEVCGSSITFPLSQHSPDSVATLLRYLYYDDVSHISYEAALYLLHHCTDFFGLASNALEAACEQLIINECDSAAANPSAPRQPPEIGPDGERRVGLSDVVRMSWRMSKWPLFERAVKFLDWRGLDALVNQTYSTAPSPPLPSATRSPPTAASPLHPLYSTRAGAAATAAGGVGVGGGEQSEEKTNSDSLQLLAAQSTSSSAASSPPHPVAVFDMELVRAIIAEKANPGVTMRERGGVIRDEASSGPSREDSRDHSRSDSLRVDGVGLLRIRREEEEDEDVDEEEEDEVEEDLMGGGVEDGELDDEDRRHEEDDDDELFEPAEPL